MAPGHRHVQSGCLVALEAVGGIPRVQAIDSLSGDRTFNAWPCTQQARAPRADAGPAWDSLPSPLASPIRPLAAAAADDGQLRRNVLREPGLCEGNPREVPRHPPRHPPGPRDGQPWWAKAAHCAHPIIDTLAVAATGGIARMKGWPSMVSTSLWLWPPGSRSDRTARRFRPRRRSWHGTSGSLSWVETAWLSVGSRRTQKTPILWGSVPCL